MIPVMSTGEGTLAARRGRPPKINRTQIVEAAIGLGLDTFTMQGIAEHLGVTSPALYSYVAGRDEVLALVTDALRQRLDAFSSAATTWREWLIDFAQLVRRDLAPSASSLMVDLHGPGTADQLGVGERGLQLLMDDGFSAAEAGSAVWLVFRVALTAGPEQGTDLARYVDETRRALLPTTAPTLPATQAVNLAFASGARDTFSFDLHVLLDGLERWHRATPASAPG